MEGSFVVCPTLESFTREAGPLSVDFDNIFDAGLVKPLGIFQLKYFPPTEHTVVHFFEATSQLPLLFFPILLSVRCFCSSNIF